MFKRKWKEVYERLPIERKDRSLTEISGFTNFCYNPKVFRKKIIQNLLKEFDLKSKVNICEIGCGCGDKLSYFYRLGHRCFGVDYSENMIKRARKEMPNAKLYYREANQLPFKKNSMHFVFSYSVFIYFESKHYCDQVLKEMYRIAKPKATICIWDVPDIQEKNNVIKLRGCHQKGYEHTYYDMNYFIQWFKKRKIKNIKSEYTPIKEYKLSNYRFNITVKLDK